MDNVVSHSNPDIRPDISSLSLEVHIKAVIGLTSGTEARYLGTGILEINNIGMKILPRKSGKLLLHSVKESYGATWQELKELKNLLLTKKRFRANFGKDKKGNDILVWVALHGEDKGKAAELSAILSKINPEASMKRCTVCSGVVENGICKNCGRNFKTLQRQKGIGWLAGGIILFIAGWVLTTSSEKSTSQGWSITIYFGLLGIGVVMAIVGIIKIISGKR